MAVIQYGDIALAPDEAQYWTWSQQLDWGYYSKPPGIAWDIWAGTQLFGNTELGVRFGALVISAILPFAAWHLAAACGLNEAGRFLTGLVMALSPLGIISSLLATTDAPFILFWTLCLAEFCLGLQQKKAPNYLLIGLYVFLGALFKWPIYYLWGIMLLASWVWPYARSRHFFTGVFISLLGLLPSISWNYSRNWPTFQHVFSTITGGHQATPANIPLFRGNFIEFVAAQAALLSPILFVLLLLAGIKLVKARKQAPVPLLLCGCISAGMFAIYAISSLFMKMQGNWAVFVYPTAMVLIAWWAVQVLPGRYWVYGGTALSVLLCLLLLIAPTLQANSYLRQLQIPYTVSPFRECLGWRKLTPLLQELAVKFPGKFYLADTYQMSSLLSFYGPEQQRAYFINLGKTRKNQFSYWPGLAQEHLGDDGIFVRLVQHPQKTDILAVSAAYQHSLAPYFSEVEFTGYEPLFYSYGKPVKGALFYKGYQYNGNEPASQEIY